MPFGIPASLLGFIVKGDLAGQTIYTDRHARKVFFPAAPPDKPPSPLQQAQRNRFKAAQADYMDLTDAQKADYELASQRLSLCMTGQNLYIHLALKCDDQLTATLERQSGVYLAYPFCVPFQGESPSSSS